MTRPTDEAADIAPRVGEHATDLVTRIDGILIAHTHWHDRSDECAILRQGVDSDGRPWDIHWFPIFRLRQA